MTLPYIANGLGSGQYIFSFEDVNGCAAQNISATIIDPNSPNEPLISQGDTISFCQGQSVDLTSSYVSGNTWSTNEITQTISNFDKDNSIATIYFSYRILNLISHFTVYSSLKIINLFRDKS